MQLYIPMKLSISILWHTEMAVDGMSFQPILKITKKRLIGISGKRNKETE
jgi:hypothetical protein